MLEVVRQTAPSDSSIASMTERLANAWLDLADKRIGEKQAADASRALQSARSLAPANPRLARLEQALRELSPAGG
jgi:hypothetical protein